MKDNVIKLINEQINAELYSAYLYLAFADYYEEVCDGQTYSFVFYDVDGNQHVLYDGYIYENAELNSILDMFY